VRDRATAQLRERALVPQLAALRMVGDQLEGVPMEDGEVLEYDDMPF
jgi:hypothetical protein